MREIKASANGIPVVFTGASKEIWDFLRTKFPGKEMTIRHHDAKKLAEEAGMETAQTLWDLLRRFESRGLLQDRRRFEGIGITWRFTELPIGVTGKVHDPEKPTLVVPVHEGSGGLDTSHVFLPSVHFSRDLRDESDEILLQMYMADVRKFVLLTKAEEQELGRRIKEQKDPEAREKMINHNLRLVVHWAFKHKGRGLTLMDLIQYGNEGLITAVEQYDHTQGNKFSTYASWWIRSKIWRGLQDGVNMIHVPVYMYELFGKVSKAIKSLEKEGMTSPSAEQIAEKAGMLQEEVKCLLEFSRTSQVTELDAVVGLSGLNGKREGEEGDTPGAFIEDPSSLSQETVVMAKRAMVRLSRQLEIVLGRVWDKRREYLPPLILYLGLDNATYAKRSMDKVAGNLELIRGHRVTRSRIQQVIEGACRIAGISSEDLRWLVERLRLASEITEEPLRTYSPSAVLETIKLPENSHPKFNAPHLVWSKPETKAKLEHKQAGSSAPVPTLPLELLNFLPIIEKEVFKAYYGLGTKRKEAEEVAIEFGMPVLNIRRVIERVWAKLKDQGVVKEPHLLLAAMNRSGRD